MSELLNVGGRQPIDQRIKNADLMCDIHIHRASKFQGTPYAQMRLNHAKLQLSRSIDLMVERIKKRYCI